MQRPPLSLKGRALRLLSGREHSRAELELKRVLDELQAKGFIDERRVAESVLHRRAGKLGAMRIRQELQVKGLSEELVRSALASLKATELARARDVWQRKFGVPATDAAQRAKQARFLASRGFSGEVVRRVVSQDD